MRLLPLALVALASIACAPKDGAVRRARLRAERRNLEATLEHLEDRMIVSQARVRFWQEMRERHESVAAVACASQNEHAEAMASSRSLPAPERHSSLHQSKVARAEGSIAVAGTGSASGMGGP